MRKLLTTIITAGMLMSFSPSWASSQAINQVFIEQRLEAMGIAGSPWEEHSSYDEERLRAYTDALNHAYEKIINLPLMDGVDLRQVVQSNRALKQRLGELLLGAKKTFYQTDLSGINRCKIEIDLSGKNSLRSTFYLASLRPSPMQPESFLASWTAGIKVDKAADPSKYRRVIIDARKSHFSPSLFPRFFAQNGMLIFQEAMIPPAERFSRPVVRFVTSMVEAREGVEERFVYTVESLVDAMHPRDVVINPSEVSEFALFCNDIVRTPQKEREIVIVFDADGVKEYGALKQAEEKADKKKE